MKRTESFSLLAVFGLSEFSEDIFQKSLERQENELLKNEIELNSQQSLDEQYITDYNIINAKSPQDWEDLFGKS